MPALFERDALETVDAAERRNPMAVRLLITETDYALQEWRDESWSSLSTLQKGARALLDPQRPLDERQLEFAIQAAEDWLMPHAPGLRAQVLGVQDTTGRVRTGLSDLLSVSAGGWTLQEFEAVFLRLVDMATRRAPPPALQQRALFVADILLLRELAHHGQVRSIQLA